MYLRNRENISLMKTRKLKKRGQNGGITLKDAKRLLNSISPSVAIGRMATRFKSKKVSPLSPEPIGSPTCLKQKTQLHDITGVLLYKW